MNTQRFILLLLCAALLFTGITPAEAKDKEEKKVEDAIAVLNDIMKIPEEGLPAKLLNDAYGVAVIPGVIKVGFVLGGRRGHGILVTKDEDGQWSNPAFITLTGGSLGFQIGAQSTDVILVFKSAKSIEGIIRGKFTLGADAAVAAGPVGRQAEMGTDLQLKAEIFSYSRNRGLFAGLALEGSALSIDEDSNEDFYNNEDLTARDILGGRKIKAPAVAEEFKRLLKKYSEIETSSVPGDETL
jgi:lipid-binding SYLF domain-containing protein